MSEKKKRVWVRDAAIYSALRRAHRNSPEYHEALKLAKSEYFILSKKGKQMRRVHFQCAHCPTKATRKNVAVDHINAVIDPRVGKTTLDDYANRLFCGTIGLQILCKPCHSVKSKLENAVRRKVKKEKANEQD
jgi:5-methylcytosine-specific restriction endonuclease McrA